MSKEFMNKCYGCQYRGEAQFSVHSKCEHPITKVMDDNSKFVFALALMAGSCTNKEFAKAMGATSLGIKGDEHGIRKGWFNWPLDFDPVWLENCNGFTPKEETVANAKANS